MSELSTRSNVGDDDQQQLQTPDWLRQWGELAPLYEVWDPPDVRAGKPELIRDFIEAYTMMKEMEHDREELEKSDQAKKRLKKWNCMTTQ